MDTQQIKTRLKQVKNFLKARKFDGVIKNAEDILHILEKETFTLEDKLQFQIKVYYDCAVAYYEKQQWGQVIEIAQKSIDLLRVDSLKKELSILEHMNIKINIRYRKFFTCLSLVFIFLIF